MSKTKNRGLDQYCTEPFKQQQFGPAGVEGVNVTVSADLLSVMLYTQVSNDDCYNSANESRPTAAEDSVMSDSLLLHRPTDGAELCRESRECTDSQRSRHGSDAAMLESASLSSYNTVFPQLSRSTATPSSLG